MALTSGKKVSIHTAHKWIAEKKKELATATWLTCTYERLDRYNVAASKCKNLYNFRIEANRNAKLQSCFY